MRIAFDYQIFCLQEYGGISRYVYELGRELATNYGQDVNVVSPLYVNQYLKEVPHGLRLWGVPISRIPKTGRIVRAVSSLLSRPLVRWLQPDILHETYYSMAGLAPTKTKVIVTVHDMIHERFPSLFSARDRTRREKLASVARADHVICVSRQTQRDLIELAGIHPSKTSVVHHGFALSTDYPSNSAAAPERPYLLYVGNRDTYKNFEGLLKAVAASPLLRKEMRVVCFGGGALTKREKALAAELDFPNGGLIQISGSDAVLTGLYQHAEALVYPSLYEGFGIPPLEAMSFDCPVACSGAGSIPEVVGNAGAYFDPTDIDDMRSVIEQLVTDETQRRRLIYAGRKRIGEFSWARCASETLAVYRHVLTGEL